MLGCPKTVLLIEGEDPWLSFMLPGLLSVTET